MGYSWVSKGSASGLSFTYGNQLYTYNAITNTLDLQSSSSHTSRTKDLVMVLDLSKMTSDNIVNNSFKIFVNHYKLK